MSSVPFTRSLPYVLSRALGDAPSVRLSIAKVASVPDAGHVVIDVGGVHSTVPRLASYAPTVGEPVYLLVAETLILAIGTVK